MKAMILAAGLGTRLKPLTDERPKALVRFKGIPLLERIVRNLAAAGIDHILINVHHFGDQVIEYVRRLEVRGTVLDISDEREKLMDTGGAILQARDYFAGESAFLVHNVDVLTDLDIRALIEAHRSSEALATVAVKKRPTTRSLLFDSQGWLSGWRQNETGETRMVRHPEGDLEDYGNSCIQVISGEFFRHFPETGVRNLTDLYLELAANHRIQPYIHNRDYWYDLGRYERFLKADKEVF